MGSFPSKQSKEEVQPLYYDLKEMVEVWADIMYHEVWKRNNKERYIKNVYFRHNYSFLNITDREPRFEKSITSVDPESDNVQYTTVVDERTYINNTTLTQSCSFNADGYLETTFSAELKEGVKIDNRCNVSFVFDCKKLPEQHRFGKEVKQKVFIEEMRDGKLKWETKDKLKWSASYPINVSSKTKLTAQLYVRVKEESLDFFQPITLTGKILVDVIASSNDSVVTSLTGDIHSVVECYLTDNGEAGKFFEVVNDDEAGYVQYETKGKVKWSLGVEEIIKLDEESLSKSKFGRK